MPSYYKLLISFGFAIVVTLALSWVRMEGTTRLMVAWDAFSLCMIGISLGIMFTICPKQIRVLASHEDSSRAVSFVILMVAIMGSLLGVLLLLGNRHGWLLSKWMETLIYITGVSASWILLHIMFTFRYAHLFYGKHEFHHQDVSGGLEVPGEKCPDYLDFAFPYYWHYDVLRALDYFRASGAEPDSRIAAAVEVVRSKRQPDGRWLLDRVHPGRVHFALEGGVGEPSRWNTLRALRVLDWWQG